MRVPQRALERQLRGSVELEYSIHLIGPSDLIVGDIPAPAAGMTQLLGLGKKRVRNLEFPVETRILERYRCLRSQEPQRCDARGCEYMRSETVLEVEHGDQARLLDQR